MATDPKIIDRIRKLLKMAEDSRGNPNEAAIAAARAAKLMEEYQISNAESILNMLEEDPLGAVIKEDVFLDDSYTKLPPWLRTLPVSVSMLYGTQVKLGTGIHPKLRVLTRTVRFFGFGPDVEASKWTFDFLVEECRRQADRWWEGNARFSFASAKMAKASFRLGFSTAIHERVKEELARRAAEKASSSSTGTALVVLDDAKRRAIEKAFGQFNYTPSVRREVDGHAHSAGREAGLRASLSRPLPGQAAAARRIGA